MEIGICYEMEKGETVQTRRKKLIKSNSRLEILADSLLLPRVYFPKRLRCQLGICPKSTEWYVEINLLSAGHITKTYQCQLERSIKLQKPGGQRKITQSIDLFIKTYNPIIRATLERAEPKLYLQYAKQKNIQILCDQGFVNIIFDIVLSEKELQQLFFHLKPFMRNELVYGLALFIQKEGVLKARKFVEENKKIFQNMPEKPKRIFCTRLPDLL